MQKELCYYTIKNPLNGLYYKRHGIWVGWVDISSIDTSCLFTFEQQAIAAAVEYCLEYFQIEKIYYNRQT